MILVVIYNFWDTLHVFSFLFARHRLSIHPSIFQTICPLQGCWSVSSHLKNHEVIMGIATFFKLAHGTVKIIFCKDNFFFFKEY